FFSAGPPTSVIYTLSLHDALPISQHALHDAHDPRCKRRELDAERRDRRGYEQVQRIIAKGRCPAVAGRASAANQRRARFVLRWQDRKSTRLNSSHLVISYAVFCLK